MRWLAVLAALALLGVAVTACGGSSTHRPTPEADAAGAQRFLNDGDAEKVNDYDPDNRAANHEDSDADSAEEYEETFDNGDYHDSDDRSVLFYGHAASAADAHAITAVITRYYADAAAQDGAAACTMLTPAFASSLPEAYGHTSGLPYLRGGKSCQAILSLLFKHFHAKLAGTTAVTGVRVASSSAIALLGSSRMPAGEISMQREGSVWKLAAMLGTALP